MISNPHGSEEERFWFEYFIGDLLDTFTSNKVNNIILGEDVRCDLSFPVYCFHLDNIFFKSRI